jgi:hypothetical protein
MNKKMREQYMQQVILYATSILQAYFQEQIDQGAFRPELKPAILARAFIGMFFPTVLIRDVIQVELLEPVDYEEIISANVQVFLRGAMIEPSGTKPAKLRQKIQVD